MENFFGSHLIAWLVYLASGAVVLTFWWRITRVLGSNILRDLLRGLAVVLAFTPWFSEDSLAPAIMVVPMDLLVGNSTNGVGGLVVLLLALIAMLIAVIVRRLMIRRAMRRG